MRKSIYLLLGILISCTSNRTDNTNQKIDIGVILPLTGDAAIYGQAMKSGIELAYSESPIKNSINLLYEDDMGKEMQAANSGQLLISKGVDVIIGGAQSKTADVLIPMITKNEIPLVSPGASSVDFDSISTYFFRLWASDSYDGNIMANYIIQGANIKDVAVYFTNSKYGVGVRKVFEKSVVGNGGKIVFSEPFEEGKKDFRTQLQKLKESNAKALFIPGYFAEVSIILKQIKELNLDIEIYGTSSFHDQKLLDLLGEAIEGVTFSYPEFNIEGGYESTKEFSKKYEAKFKSEPDIFAANSYDCFKVIEHVIMQGAGAPKEIQQDLLRIKNFPGAGGSFSFDENGNVQKGFSIMSIVNQKFVVIKNGVL